MLVLKKWRHGRAVMQEPAKLSSPVRLRMVPPSLQQKIPSEIPEGIFYILKKF